MSSLPTPMARRLVKPSWKDTRLIIGVLLVLLAIVIGALAFRAADDRVGMLAAKGTLTPGHRITEDDFVRVDVQLGDASSDYLGSSERLPNGAVIDRELRAGELVPRTSVIDPTEKRVREVPVRVDPIYLSNLAVGSRVTVYVPDPAAPTPVDGKTEEKPKYVNLMDRATVSDLPDSSNNVLGSGSAASVVLVVPESKVASLVALDEKESVKLVLDSGSPKQEK